MAPAQGWHAKSWSVPHFLRPLQPILQLSFLSFSSETWRSVTIQHFSLHCRIISDKGSAIRAGRVRVPPPTFFYFYFFKEIRCHFFPAMNAPESIFLSNFLVAWFCKFVLLYYHNGLSLSAVQHEISTETQRISFHPPSTQTHSTFNRFENI